MSTTLHCSAALLKAMNLKPLPTAASAACRSALGPWSVTLLHSRPQKLALAVCYASRQGFVFPAAPLATLPQRFGPALFQLLLMLGAPVDVARREVDAMQPLVIAPKVDVRVRSQMGQYEQSVLWRLADGAGLAQVNTYLAMNLVMRPAVFIVGERTFELLGLDAAPVKRLGDRLYGLAT